MGYLVLSDIITDTNILPASDGDADTNTDIFLTSIRYGTYVSNN